MDGRQILDGINDDILFALWNGQAPWQHDVPQGFVRKAPTVNSKVGEVEGIGGLHLGCLANRFGYDSENWNTKDLADTRWIEVAEDVRFFTTFEVKHHSRQSNDMVTPCLGYETVFNDDCAPDDRCPTVPRFSEWQPDRAARSLIAGLCKRQGLIPVDGDVMRAGIYDFVKGLEGRSETAFRFATENDLAQAVCRNIVAGRVSQACGQGWRAEDAAVIDPMAVAATVKQDPCWLVRVCREAEIRYGTLLYPEGFARVYGSPSRYREGLEQSIDEMQGEEKRQYLVVPFEDNAEVKAKGGRFDRVAKAWYVPAGRDINDFAGWDRPSELSPEAEFADAMRHHGLLVEGEAIMDGQPHRVMLEGQRPGASPAGSYTGYLDGRPAGHFTNFRDGHGKAVKWVATGHRVDPQLRSATAKEIEAKREARRRELAAKQDAAAREALARWNAASPARDATDHPYLAAKGVGGHAVRVDRHSGHLLVPLRDEAAAITSVQSIGRGPQDQGFDKRFTAGGCKQGRFHLIHRHGLPQRMFGFDDPYDVEGGLRQLRMGPHVIFIAEGYATAASVHEATGRPVVVAFDAHNLKPVAELFRKEIVRDRPFIFVADDDRNLKVNVGVGQAVDAAKAVGGAHVVVPRFDAGGLDTGLTDFNDLHRHAGIEAASRQLHAALGPVFNNFRVRRMATDADEVRVYQSDDVAPKLTPKWERIMAEELSEFGTNRSETARSGVTGPGRGR